MNDEKVDFWKTPEGKIMSYGIHEHNSGLGYIGNSIVLLKKYIENGVIEIKSTHEHSIVAEKDIKNFNDTLDLIIKGKTKCKESVDYIYTNIKQITNDR